MQERLVLLPGVDFWPTAFGASERKFLREQLFAGLRMSGFDRRLLTAMASIPREIFVPEEHRAWAYLDKALPYRKEGIDSSVSQPSIIAEMVGWLALTGKEKILEVGTGTGYQAAVLSRLAERVYSVDINERVVDLARRNLSSLGIRNVKLEARDGLKGWEEVAPFDGVIVACSLPPALPGALVELIKVGGRLVAPIGLDHREALSHYAKELNLSDEDRKSLDRALRSRCRLFVATKTSTHDLEKIFDESQRHSLNWLFQPAQGEYGWDSYYEEGRPDVYPTSS